MNYPIKNFENFCNQILNTQKTKISNLSPNYKILTTLDIENYFLKNINDLEIQSIEILKNQITISKDLAQAILNLKQENKNLKTFQEIKFDNEVAKIDLIKAYIKYEQYKNKNALIDKEDIYQILIQHFTKNKSNLKEIIKNKNFQISKSNYQNLTKLQLQLIKLFKPEILETKNDENQTKSNQENIIIETKNELSQLSFILEKISNLKETNKPETSYGIITNTIENKIKLQNYLTDYGIKLDNFSSENLLKEEIIIYLKHILKTIQNPNSENLGMFYILDKLNIREETKRRITRKSSRLEKSIFKVLLKEEKFSDFQDENQLVLDLKQNLEILLKNKNSGTKLKTLILQTIKSFKLYETLISDNQKTQIFCLNEFLKLTNHFIKTYQTNSLEQFLEYLENSIQTKHSYQTQTKELTNIQIITAKEFKTQDQNKTQNFDYTFFTNLNHTKYPLLQIKNIFNNETFPTREQDFKIQKETYNNILKQTKIKNYLITTQKSKSGINQKISKLLDKTNYQTKTYTKEIEAYKTSPEDKIKLEKIQKISELILQDKFDLAKSEIEMLKLTFGKKDLTSYISKLSPHEISTDKFNDIDTSKLVYSVSQLQTYESCPKKYSFNYIYKIPGQARHYFDFGTSVHEALEFLSSDFDKKTPIDKLYIIGTKYLTDGWISKGYESAKQEQEYFQKGLNIIKEFIQKETELRKQNRQTIGLEKKFFLDFSGRKLMGYIDRIDKVDGEIEILDYKTSKSMSNPKDLEKNMQLLVYSLAIQADQEINKFPTAVGLWYVLHDKIVTINPKIEHTIEIKKRVLELIKQIENKNFSPKPTNFGCTYCDFNQICKDSISNN